MLPLLTAAWSCGALHAHNALAIHFLRTATSRASVEFSQPPPNPSADSPSQQLLSLVAATADLIGDLARSQLTESGAVTIDTFEEYKRESRRLRRSWDARLSWRLRKRAAAEEAATAAEEAAASATAEATRRAAVATVSEAKAPARTSPANRSPRCPPGTPPFREAPAERGARPQRHRKSSGSSGVFDRALSSVPMLRTPAKPSKTERAVDWAPTLAKAAAVTAAAVMQAAEIAAVAIIKQPPAEDEAATTAQPGRPAAKEEPLARRPPAQAVDSNARPMDAGAVTRRDDSNSKVSRVASPKPRRVASRWDAAINARDAGPNEVSRVGRGDTATAGDAASLWAKGCAQWVPPRMDPNAAAISAAMVMQMAEMTAVALIKVADTATSASDRKQ